MAQRIYKLSRTLGCTVEEVFGLLHAIGFTRYRSAQDQVSDSVIKRLKEARLAGVKPVKVTLHGQEESAASDGPPGPTSPTQSGHLMDALVPGVVRQKPKKGTGKSSPPKKAVPLGKSKPKGVGAVPGKKSEKAPPVSTVKDLEDTLKKVNAERKQMAMEVADLSAKLAESQEDLQANVERVLSLETEMAEKEKPEVGLELQTLEKSLMGLGLKGPEALDACLRELAEAGELQKLASQLLIADQSMVEATLNRLIITVGGAIHPVLREFGVPVQVADGTGAYPCATVIQSQLEQLSGEFLLCGCREVTFVTSDPRWVGLLRCELDPRIELRFLSPQTLVSETLEKNTKPEHVFVVWCHTVEEGVLKSFEKAKVQCIDGTGMSVVEMVAKVMGGLATSGAPEKRDSCE